MTTTPTPNAGAPAHITALNVKAGMDAPNADPTQLPAHIRKLNGDTSSEIEADTVQETPQEETSETVEKVEKPKVKKPAPKEKKVEEPVKDIGKIKYHGKEEDFNFGDRKETIKWVQMGKASAKTYDEATALKNEAIDIARTIVADPTAALKQLGWNDEKIDNWMTDYLFKKIEYNNMSPREKQLIEREQKLAMEERKRQLGEQRNNEQQIKQNFAKTEEQIIHDLDTAFAARKDIPKNRAAKIRTYYYMKLGQERGLDLNAADVLDQVKEDLINEHKEIYGDMDEDTLYDTLGESFAKKFNKALVKRVKKDQTKIQQNPESKAVKKKTAPTSFKDNDEFFEHLRNLDQRNNRR